MTMRRYRAAIFKYAILINVALALYVLWLGVWAIRDHAVAVEHWTASRYQQFGFDDTPEPHARQLLFGWTLAVAAVVLMVTSIASFRRGRSWDYWLRIFSFLPLLWVAWFQALWLVQFFIDEGAGARIFQSPNVVSALLISLLATLWLAYNISYRPAAPDAGAPSR